MTDYTELVKKLRNYASFTAIPPLSVDLSEAADAIEELQSRVKKNDDWWARAKTLADMVAPKWIPVTEEPPLKVGDDGYNGYLVLANGYYEVADYTTDKFDNAPYFHVNGEYEPDVTHYMPLPEPPKEGE